MTLDTPTLGFWILAAIAAWMQTLSGFALGLVLMGGAALFNLMPLPQAALVTSILVVFNGAMVLGRDWRFIDRQAFTLTLIGSIPTLGLGFAALHWLAGQTIGGLQVMLGLLISGAALQLAVNPKPLAQRSAPAVFVATGVAGGILGGLFATAGPPIIWNLYRQPIALTAIRVTLVSVFVVNQILRLGMAQATTGIGTTVLWTAAGTVPAVTVGTYVARRWPPPLGPQAMRRMAFALLMLSGGSLAMAGIVRLISG